jgi:hypothetical protein
LFLKMAKSLSITLDPRLLHLFFPFFQQGIIIKTQVGRSIQNLLLQTLNISPEYVENRIQTVFLDGKAVDDLESAVIRNGSTLALSGALPGLVGATLRRKGTYASLRRGITLSSDKNHVPTKDGVIVLKLFNLLLPELAPSLLAAGVWVHGNDLDHFLKKIDESFWSGIRNAEIDDRRTDLPAIRKINWSKYKRPVLLRLNATSTEC